LKMNVLIKIKCFMIALLLASQIAMAHSADPTVHDLRLIQTSSTTTGLVGDVVTFTVKIYNEVPSNVSGVAVTFTLPIGMTLQGIPSVTGGSFSGGIWTIPTLNNATDSLILTIMATIDTEGPKYTKAEITAMNEVDVDSQVGNSSIGGVTLLEDDVAFACVSVPFLYCYETTVNIEVAAPSGMTNYKWFKNGNTTPVAMTQNYTISDVGNYTYTAEAGGGASCPTALCCPVTVVKTPAPGCVPVRLTKI
jgi:uncharacterized repeat protein (TIGR01451 family)